MHRPKKSGIHLVRTILAIDAEVAASYLLVLGGSSERAAKQSDAQKMMMGRCISYVQPILTSGVQRPRR